MRKRRWLLPFILIIILVPVLSVLVFSGVGIYKQQHALVVMSQRYAEGLSRSIIQEEIGIPGESTLSRHRRLGLYLKMLTLGPPVPGWIAILGPNGVKLQGSPGSIITPAIAEKVNKALTTGEMQTMTVYSDRRPPSAAAIRPYPDGMRAVVVVISHYLVPGAMMRAIQFQPLMSIGVSFIALLGIFLLWRWCVMPLRRLASRVETMQWGKETLSERSSGPLPELRGMQQALTELSARAVDREKLKKNYVGDIVRTQEEERTRVAREIHDSPLQSVASLIQRIQLALRALGKSEPDVKRASGHLEAAQEAALSAVQDMRDVCDRLSPPWLALGAEKSVEEVCSRLSRIHNLSVSPTVTGHPEMLSEKDVLAVCRIIQEAAANAARHGHASEVKVSLDCTGDPYTLTITDNGTGIDRQFDPEVLRVQGHRGISSMTERASLIGGTFSIRRGDAGGTVITVTIPARKEAAVQADIVIPSPDTAPQAEPLLQQAPQSAADENAGSQGL
jgi:signal transduction histidine kinase